MSTSLGNVLWTKVISNLDTYTYTINTVGDHNVSCQMTMQPGSSLSIVIKQNGTTIATSTAPSSTQTQVSLSVGLLCASGDALQVIVSSTAPSDSAINTVKGIIKIAAGVYQN